MPVKKIKAGENPKQKIIILAEMSSQGYFRLVMSGRDIFSRGISLSWRGPIRNMSGRRYIWLEKCFFGEVPARETVGYIDNNK